VDPAPSGNRLLRNGDGLLRFHNCTYLWWRVTFGLAVRFWEGKELEIVELVIEMIEAFVGDAGGSIKVSILLFPFERLLLSDAAVVILIIVLYTDLLDCGK
jgi:hypothetical protein